jgi:hypothetical protein
MLFSTVATYNDSVTTTVNDSTITKAILVNRDLRQRNSYNQLFVGGEFRLQYENKAVLKIAGEFQMTKDYHVLAALRYDGLQVSQERVLRSPSLIEQFVLSNHFNWENDFNNSVTDRSAFQYAGKIGERQYLKLGASYTNIKRYIYFNTLAQPLQETGNQRFLEARLSHNIHFGPLHFDNFVAYTNTDKADKIRIPEWVVDSKVYFQGSLFKKALYGQFGVEMYLPKGYYADAYMPVTQQFYLQNDVFVKTYPVFDVFLTADIKTLNVFLKMSHVNYDIWAPGYFATPYYPGLRRSFVFGLKWMFFD